VSVVSDILEEDTPAEERDLQGLDVNVGVVVPPCVPADAIRDDCAEKAVEVAEEEDCPSHVRMLGRGPLGA
jgi:hypothetical protein